MEYLDYYDESGTYLGYAPRDVVHREGLWHKTVQNWLYTKDGKILFQIRKDSGKFYTTSSGHVKKDETVAHAFKREMNEEIGLELESSKAKMIELVTWIKDKVNKDGSITKDRAKSSFFIIPYEGDFTDFKFDPNEVLGIGAFDARELLKLFEKNEGEIEGLIITDEDGKLKKVTRTVGLDEFLVLKDETALEKYGNVLKNVIEELEVVKN